MNYHFLTKTILFRGCSEQEIKEMLCCLGAKERAYKKGSVILHAGETAHAMGLILFGSVHIENDDLWGNKNILDCVSSGQIFAETYACLPGEPMMVSAVAAEDCSILLLNAGRLLQTCSNTCRHHSLLIRNLLAISAGKNLNLSRRIFHTSPKSIRGRLLSYLSFQAAKAGTRTFSIPFNRQQLADYLSVDRSALSAELGKMQREGLITVNKNQFSVR